MTLLKKSGPYGYSEELALFEKPVIDAGVEKVRWIEYKPVNQISHGSNIEFVVSGNGNQYIDLRRTRLYIKAKVTLEDGRPLPSDEPIMTADGKRGDPHINSKVGPINLWLHSLFNQVDVYLQQKLVTSSNTNYYLKAYLDTLLFCKYKDSYGNLQAELFFKDTGGHMDETDPLIGTNTGLMLRQKFISQSSSVDMEGSLKSDVFNIDRYLLNGVEMRIVLSPSPSSLNLMAYAPNPSFKSIIQDATLKVCHISPTPQMITAHQETLSKNHMALYPYMKSELKRFTVSKGAYDFTKDDVFQHMVPVKLVVCLINNEALSGSFKLNPFNFHHYYVSYIEVAVDGESIPGRALQPVFKTNSYQGNYVDAFLNMHCRLLSGEEDQSIERPDFGRGYTMFVFDLEPEIRNVGEDESNDDFWPAVKSGNLRVDIHFKESLPETISIVMYGIFPKMIKIDHTRTVLLE